jgi:hypothetical protein
MTLAELLSYMCMLDDVFTDEFVREAREIAQGVEVREHCIIVRGVRERYQS